MEVSEDKEKSVGGIGAVEDDLTLRAALYGVLFQSYTDKVGYLFHYVLAHFPAQIYADGHAQFKHDKLKFIIGQIRYQMW